MARQQQSSLASHTDVKVMSLAILVLAGVGLAFQVALTRTFSLIFQYNYVFLVVSLAILGLGIGAALGYVVKQISHRNIMWLATLVTASFPVNAVLLAQISSSDLLFFAVAISLVPFVFIGWVNAWVYANYAEHSHRIYAADLVGAVIGLILSPFLMVLAGPISGILAIGLFSTIAIVFLAWSSQQLPYAIVAVVIMFIVFGMNHLTGLITYNPANMTSAPPDKTLIHVLHNPSLDAQLIDTQWGAFAQVDLVETNDDSVRFVFTDAGAGSIMLDYDPSFDDLAYSWLKREISYLPFNNGSVNNTLIIGAGAGYDVVQARLAGAEHITAVEINPTIVDLTNAYADYNGDILNLPDVETIITDGRNFVDRTEEDFDLIYLNLVYSQAAHPGSSALAENYTFTTEALSAYLDHLSPDGRIGFVTHSGIHGVRLMMTALSAMQIDGISLSDGLLRMALVKSPNPMDPIVTPSVLIINQQPWAEDEAQKFGEDALRRGLEILYLPHIMEDSVSVLLDDSMTLDEYLANNTDFNISPTTDNQPFFYHLNPGLPDSIDDILIWSLLIVTGYFIVISALSSKSTQNEWIRPFFAVYFALLGIGFFLAEVALIQYFRLLIGDPILSFTVAVGAMLLGGGAGSWFGQRYLVQKIPRYIGMMAVGIALWLVLSTILYPIVVNVTLKTPLMIRIGVTMMVLFPLGFLLGFPFPGGLRLARQHDMAGIPLFWGMNALASTLGAVLATVFALLIGFQMTLIVGAGFYLIVAIMMLGLWTKVIE